MMDGWVGAISGLFYSPKCLVLKERKKDNSMPNNRIELLTFALLDTG